LSARDHRDRFKNGAHQNRLQENERRKMRSGPEAGRQTLSSSGAGRTFMRGSERKRLVSSISLTIPSHAGHC
jgi:hypothetical protein